MAKADIQLYSNTGFYQIIAKTNTIGMMNSIFPVDNKYISTCDTNFVSLKYEKQIEQSNLSEHKIIDFISDKRSITFTDLLKDNFVTTKIDGKTQNKYFDIFSMIFHIRGIGKNNEDFPVASNFDLWNVNVKYLKNETIKINKHKTDCKKYQLEFTKTYNNPIESPTDVLTNNLFNEKSVFFVWISSDTNQLLVRFHFKNFPFGVSFTLQDFWQK